MKQSKSDPRLRLFCFPYAGGSAGSIYRTWNRMLPNSVDVCPVELPGRGARFSEPLQTHMRPLVRSIVDRLGPLLGQPFAFFGHSMGALLSYEVARALRSELGIGPVRMFVSGHRAPQNERVRKELIHKLNDPELTARLQTLNGTPEEVIRHRELMRLVLPIVRADFQVLETYAYVKDAPLSCSITGFLGDGDGEVRPAEMEGWGEVTDASFSLTLLPGDHFYIHAQQARLLQAIGRELVPFGIG